jgi:maltooligosyltrehalose trehalohydrolase
MTHVGDGYFETFVADIGAGSLYRYSIDGGEPLPDPASRFQPKGVHGPSMVIDPRSYAWRHEEWQAVPQPELVFYELHVGTFSPEGSFEGVRKRLSYLKDLGITALELMPLADFPGRWNWGYDPAALFAPSRAYGTPDELRALIDEARGLGLAVFLDVIYNHLGPDGVYLLAYAPQFFTDKHHTPWGQAINLDDEDASTVRSFLVENALHWLLEYRFDGLRLDATHALIDDGEKHFLAELSEAVEGLEPKRYLIAEDHRNLDTLILPRERGGYGLDGVWADDFHHQVRRITAGDKDGYYADFSESTSELAQTLRQGWFYTGQYSRHMGERRGTDPAGIPPEKFVIAIQNHDQIGNRPRGNRLSDDIPLNAYRAASALLLCAPQAPLLYMGQEWATKTPFIYFTDHHPELGKLVSKGRKEEFKDFPGFSGEVPDPQDPETFLTSKLDWAQSERGLHAKTLNLYRDLLSLRRGLSGETSTESPVDGGIVLTRGKDTLYVAFRDEISLPLPSGGSLVWHSEAESYADAPHPPRLVDGRLYFSKAAAALVSAEEGKQG